MVYGRTDVDRLIRFTQEIKDLREVNDGYSSKFRGWHNNVERIIVKIFGDPSLHLDQFRDIIFTPRYQSASTRDTLSDIMERAEYSKTVFLAGLDTAKTLLDDFIEESLSDLENQPRANTSESLKTKQVSSSANNKKIFLVHGHDKEFLLIVKDFVTSLDLDPIILHEKADEGLTLIEKVEKHSEVSFAIVLLSPDDEGYPKGKSDEIRYRARQNAILELGYFLGKLGRSNVVALFKGNVEIPSDYEGVLFKKFEDVDWKIQTVREMKKAGLELDLNKLAD